MMQENYFLSHVDQRIPSFSEDLHFLEAPLSMGDPNLDLYYDINLETIESVESDEMYSDVAEEMKRKYDVGPHRPVLVVEGYRIFDDKRLRDAVDLPIFIKSNFRRIRFSSALSGGFYDVDYIESRLIPEYRDYKLRCCEEVKNLVEINISVGFDVMCNKVKKLLVEQAEITYRLDDLRSVEDKREGMDPVEKVSGTNGVFLTTFGTDTAVARTDSNVC